MIVFFKEDGIIKVRPAYIGFIKNNYLRRTAMIVCAPFMLVLHISLCLLGAAFVSITLILKSFYLPIINVVPAIKQRWYEPRKK